MLVGLSFQCRSIVIFFTASLNCMIGFGELLSPEGHHKSMIAMISFVISGTTLIASLSLLIRNMLPKGYSVLT